MFFETEIETAWPILRFAFNLAAASSIVAALGSLCAWLCRRQAVPLQHGILVSTIVVVAFSPLLFLASQAFGWRLLSINAPEGFDGAVEAHHAASESRRTVETTSATSVTQPADTEPVAGGERRSKTSKAVRFETPSWSMIGYIALSIWGLGIVVGLARHAHGVISVCQFRRSLGVSTNQELSDLANSVLGRQLGQRRFSVYVSALTNVPISLGLFRPVIVVPEYLVDLDSRERLRLVLLHEAAHILRRDHWMALVQQLAAIIYWWNPVLHQVNRRLCHVRELICDDHAAENRTEGRILAETLVSVAERSVTRQCRLASALVQDEVESLEERVRRLLQRSNGVATRMSATGRSLSTALAILLASLLVVGNVRAARQMKPTCSVTVVYHTDEPAANMRIVPAVSGYQGGLSNSSSYRALQTDDTGRVEIRDRPLAAHYVARPESNAPFVFTPRDCEESTSVTLPRAPIWTRHVPRKLRSAQLVVGVAPAIHKEGDVLAVTLTNLSRFDLILTRSDLSIFSDHWRVFPPESEQRQGMVVRGRGGTVTLHLNWENYVRSGLWCRRPAADHDGRESDSRGTHQMDVRVSVSGVNSALFPIAPPEDVLARQTSKPKRDPYQFTGHWLLTLPSGFEHRVTLTPLGRNRYRLTPRELNMSGIYTIRGNQMRMLEPNDSRLKEFVWETADRDVMSLVAEPTVRETGASYLGATLTRQLEDPNSDRRQTVEGQKQRN